MAQASVDRVTRRVLVRARRAMMRESERRMVAIDRAYQRAAAVLRERLRGIAAPATIERLTREALNDALETIEPVIEANIQAGAAAGATTPAEQFRAVFRQPAPAAATAEESAIAFREAQRVLRGETRVDGISITRRLRRNHRQLAEQMADTVTRSIRAGESLTRTAERLLDIDDLTIEMPRHVRELEQAARIAAEHGDPAVFERVVERWQSRIDRLGAEGGDAFTMRRATEQMVADMRAAVDAFEPERIRGITDRWAVEKARYRARQIARSETIEAHRAAYVASTRDKPWVKGYRWELSGRHKPDECDILAGQDLHGLGPGGYPVNDLPQTPHPNDLCTQTAIIDRHHNRRELARRTGAEEPPREWESGESETSEEWLRRQPAEIQRQILGPTRLERFREGDARVLGRHGVPRPVWRVEGRPGPRTRQPSPDQRRAQPRVTQDRAAGQVQPFPDI